jgi:uncharacterized protein (TIGR03437 family)
LQVVVTTTAGNSSPFMVTSQVTSPGFFPWPNNQPVATHLDFTYAAANGSIVGVNTVPAAPGETIVLWGSGFGPTTPAYPFGVEIPATPVFSTSNNVVVTLNGAPATVYANVAALASTYAGLYQLGVTIPASLANGTYTIITTVNGITSPPLMLTVSH